MPQACGKLRPTQVVPPTLKHNNSYATGKGLTVQQVLWQGVFFFSNGVIEHVHVPVCQNYNGGTGLFGLGLFTAFFEG